MQRNTKSFSKIRQFIQENFGPDVKGRSQVLFNTFPDQPNPFTIYFDIFIPILNQSNAVLDAGCSRGLYSFSLPCKRIVGVDSDPQEIIEANKRKKNRKARYLVANLLSLKAMQKFDAILCQNVIEHIANPDTLIETFGHILRARGHVLILTPSIQNPLYWLNARTNSWLLQIGKRILHIPYNRTPLAYHANTAQQLDALFAKYGFQKKALHAALDAPITIHSPIYLFVWRMVNTFLTFFKLTAYYPILAVVYQKN